jgi:TRAP-type uncharacterized transport system fused permease subunit
LISGVDELDPNNPAMWQWITNPFEIIVIFTTAVAGMFAFSSAIQGWMLTKVNIFERILLLVVVPFMLIPNIMMKVIGFPSEYISYLIGFVIYSIVYFLQKNRF